MREVFRHHTVEMNNNNRIPNPKKKRIVTRCIIIEDKTILAEGVTVLRPGEMNLRKLGNQIAQGRAYKALALKKSFGDVPTGLRAYTLTANYGIYFDDTAVPVKC